ncbi:hypothetical protein WR25_24583 [Diploscapter pachys]|uniref:non-specific serine/threonine protein kinase n=1 Tax=Diploscapter pachys TaxID=2018661 RepID=A0A2A2JCC0_9BILA|nr:hypothetical protein WR25_24583 [Diploscapter pachys]
MQNGQDLRSLHKSNGIQFDMKKWLFIRNIVFLSCPCSVDQNSFISVTFFIRKNATPIGKEPLIGSFFVLHSASFSNFNSINFTNIVLGSTMNPGNTLESPRGTYKIVEKLGEGGFGGVYLTDYTAKNASNSERVALKKIALHGMDEKEKEECKKEAELMERISESSTNQHIVKYLDSFQSHDNLFIAMDYCSREDLSSKIKANVNSKEKFDPETIYDYIYQIADGISELHKYNIVHRDLKPANILIAWENGKEVLKISDFGLAKVIESLNITQSHSKRCGTELYMSPEQRGNIKCRFSIVDIWAIGIIFYELCIVPRILDESEMGDIREKVKHDQRDTTWLNKMIAKDPNKRMSAGQVRDEARGPDPPEWRGGASVAYCKGKLYYLGGWKPGTMEDTNRVDLLMVIKVKRYIDYQTMNGNGLKLERFQNNEVIPESHR